MAEPAPTHVLLRICARFVREPRAKETNYSLTKSLDVSETTVWDTLRKLEGAGWLKSEVERRNPLAPGRPPRRFYKITDAGAASAKALLVELQCPGLARST